MYIYVFVYIYIYIHIRTWAKPSSSTSESVEWNVSDPHKRRASSIRSACA